MIRRCTDSDFKAVFAVINSASGVYKGVIPQDRWKEPYMPEDELRQEIARGVEFWGYEVGGAILGVMGLQEVKDVTLIRHAYVLPDYQNRGIGSALLKFLLGRTARPVLIGTWKAAIWAIKFYEKHGFSMVDEDTKDRLLRKYWLIPERQIETSVVLADAKWFSRKEEVEQ